VVIGLAVLSACGDREANRLAALQSKCSALDVNYTEENVKGCTAFLAEPSLARPVRAQALNIRGNTYDALGQHDLAIADYTEVTKLLPDFSAAYANLGLQYARKGDFKTALQFYEQALKIDPKSSYAMYGKGVTLSRLGQIEAARGQIALANLADPAMAGIYRSMKMEPVLE
jgi:lipoprotein NlpI